MIRCNRHPALREGPPIYKLAENVYHCKQCGALFQVQLKMIGELKDVE